MLKTNDQQMVFSGFTNPGVGSSQTDNHKKITLPNKLNLLQPLRQWLDSIEIENQKFARFVAKLIPAQCPFERDVVLLGRKVAHIPPMCKLNPLYDELVGLRFRALCYLVDQCGEDIQSYC
ncbi:Mo-dependent nitrogenase C-terminal domain-containing protein [Aetokthonos hydrillicola Thurmond2011]|uniref:Mo-dependent nitrogenase C-terminal domain-containing protein n=1 Tax=Aetokthonos hydrillicola Thurmond2011 TaxID=2712845 RepID=A0AAP5I3D9_9CYAN|nr:Mo-dependent nitrogenase C-terminal domain-containing protein [Aetokthonos hydrillicola]MBO3459293.1 nitrogenase [Aetokthonos hydrillicola CCALA 1050]MBW4590603.1 Mo-dependent nitrogenase C-terminal domain-containing protein [Aetokthonos hydrillicola CCALA 1050]MDR9894368.1 Mo-dependent nitrogenase C-terminal domain-containing protein [Aetokthonos hydrillicola Thurmond2011]